jgi:hypothetical protein
VAWRKDVELKTKWQFDTEMVTSDITLYAERIKETDKDKQVCEGFCSDCEEFCLYANVEDFHKTAPFINAYISQLSKNDWSDERKLQALTAWLNEKPCIISAKLEPVVTNRLADITLRSTPMRPPCGIIAVRICEKGITGELLLEIGPRWPYESEMWVATGYSYMKPGEVIVTTQSLSSIGKVFDFINLLDFKVLMFDNIYYVSSAYDRDYVLDLVFKKNYYAGIIGTIPGTQIFTPAFHGMENMDYQTNWLKFMADYQLVETIPYGAQITFLVPAGKEREWAAKILKDHEFVNSTDVRWWYSGM